MNVLVVDDELLIRQSIVRNLKNLEITNIETATDGIEALEKIKTFKPDIIIADIRMPGMDGLELLEKVNSQNEQIFFIFISGYDLFEYAQKAIRLDAFDYLLKPISESDLNRIIKKAFDKLSQNREHNKAGIAMNIKLRQSLEFMRRSFITEFFEHNDLTPESVNIKLKELSFNLLQDSFCIVIINIDSIGFNEEKIYIDDNKLIKYGVENISIDLFSNENIIAYPFDVEEDIGFLLNYTSNNIKDVSLNNIYNICVGIRKSIYSFISGTVTIGIGESVDKLGSLKFSFETARKALSQSILKGNNEIYLYQNTNKREENSSVIGFQIEEEMQRCFEKCDGNEAMLIIKRVYHSLNGNTFFEKNDLVKLNFHTIMLIFKILLQLGINPEKYLGDELILYKELNTAKSIESIIEWFDKLIASCMDAISKQYENKNRKQIEIAKEYVRDNYSVYISLEMIANHINLNPSYFSRLFKNETGQNFIDFVLDYRLKRAKELLKKGIYKSSDVSKMVGFNDERYFYKFFKKKTGFSPSEYKKI